MQILGRPTASLETIKKNLAQFNPDPIFIDEMLLPLWIKANEYGIDPVVMIAQSGLETGFGKFGDVLDASFFNTCGLKSRQGGDDKDPQAHDRSFDWYEGAEKQAQHLYAYMQMDLPSGKQIIDPRFHVVRGNPVYMPGGTDVLVLDRWATKPNNGTRILGIAERLNSGAVVQPPKLSKKTTTRKSLEIQ